jgi:hypothetical protein
VLKITLAALLAACLSACSTLRLAYENADSYLQYRANSYLDLDAKAAEELDERIDEFFAWHRKNALLQYASLADEAARRLHKGLSPDDVLWGYDSLVAHARQSLRVAAERMAPLLDRLTPQQIAHMQKRFAEDNRKFAREQLRGNEAERRKRRAKRLEDRLEQWVGDLSALQREKVRRFSERVPLFDELRERDRKRMQAELVEMIRTREAQARLPDWIAHWEQGREPAYRAASQHFRREFGALLVELDGTLTVEQRRRAEAQLRRYADDFRTLAQRKSAQ